jgi:LCP family protein required for cell wall assembly
VFKAPGGTWIASKVGYAVACAAAAVVLVVSAYAHFVQGALNNIASSNVGAGGPQTGAMNILLMGLESRTYWNGIPIDRGLEDLMHIGSTGGDTTNTLILIHIFAGGKKAYGFSIPRDDLVTMYGTHGYGGTQAKIDQAYGNAMAWELQHLRQTGQAAKMNFNQLYFQANEAGRLAAVETVEALTGVHIDHFAELNLIGFYQIAQAFGGIEVCVTPENGGRNLTDANSGANLKGGYQHLNAAQALSFVRERDSLSNGDLDRTHRQQAVLDYVLWDLKHEGLLTSISQVTSLLSKAQSFLITSGDWNIALFGTELQGLTGKNLNFQTLKISSYENNLMLNGASQDVNIVDPPLIKRIVHDAFYPLPPAPAPKTRPVVKPRTSKPATKNAPPVPPPSTVTVDVYNGSGVGGLAGKFSQAFVSKGYKAGAVENASSQAEPVRTATQVFYGAGATANAAKIAHYFGVTATALSSLTAGHVEVLLGTGTTAVPAGLSPVSGASGGSSPASSTSGASGGSGGSGPASSPRPSASKPPVDNGPAGGVVTVKKNAPYGIPCVN